jgi:hypothetical protein
MSSLHFHRACVLPPFLSLIGSKVSALVSGIPTPGVTFPDATLPGVTSRTLPGMREDAATGDFEALA